ncbi:MAG: hypothetical protein OXF88_09915 [Rhodobacteraceae bacterium]|nr:hypothetical protein [Paracoccaceae bacterium]
MGFRLTKIDLGVFGILLLQGIPTGLLGITFRIVDELPSLVSFPVPGHENSVIAVVGCASGEHDWQVEIDAVGDHLGECFVIRGLV